MNKKILSTAILGALFSTTATAVTLYDNDGTTFSVGGHMTATLSSHAGEDANGDEEVGVGTVSPRINMTATQALGNGYTAEAKGEWQLNMLDGGDESFTTRLGYVGVSHDVNGKIVAGTQWAPYYDVAGVADMPIAFANDFLYDNHGNLGTARAESMLSYRNSIALNDTMALNLGFGWQGTQTDDLVEYGQRGQVALSLDAGDFKVGYGYNDGDVGSETATSHIFSAVYGTYGNGLYVAGVYGMNEYMNGVEESTVTEFVAAYALSNSLNLSVNYENVEDDKANETLRSESAIQAEYNFTSKFVGFAGYQFDLEDDDDKWMMGGRYYL